MRRSLPTTLPTLLLIGSLCHGQSLGDLARQNQKQKQNNGATPRKVFTSDDVSPSLGPKPVPEAPKMSEAKPYKPLGYESYTPETWMRAIKAQKDWVAYLQQEAEKLKTPAKYDTRKAATDPEARRYWEERGIQQQLASQIPDQQKKLKEMQSEAQKAGMPASVYDPQ